MSVVTEVALNDNDISDLPLYAWQAFRWVRVLSLAKNQLKALGFGARLLAGIETLDLSENPIETLSEVHHVVSLRCCAIPTTERRLWQGAMGLTMLKDLNLSKCHLVKLPDPFGEHFHSLTNLNLAKNHMFTLPEMFTRMSALTRLDLSYMRLISLATVPTVSIPGEAVEDLGDLKEWTEVRGSMDYWR